MAASYPNGTYSPSAKANGNVIQAAWFNDPDSEIVAIEDGLRTGLQHGLTVSVAGITQSASTGSNNFAGPSTIASLSVTGASTFAGPVVFSSGVTFIGQQTFSAPAILSSGAVVSTGVIRQDSLPSWNIWLSTTTDRAAGSTTAFAWNTQEWVRGDVAHSTSVTPTRVTITTTGIYEIIIRSLVVGQGGGGGGNGSAADLTVMLNDTSALLTVFDSPFQSSGAIQTKTLEASGLIRIAAPGYLTVTASAVVGTEILTYGSTSAPKAARFMGRFLG